MEEHELYISKARYDTLLRQFMCLKRENHDLKDVAIAYKEAWKELKNRTKHMDDRVIDDICQFDTLEEEKAYLIGAFNSRKATEWDMEELEEKCYVANRK